MNQKSQVFGRATAASPPAPAPSGRAGRCRGSTDAVLGRSHRSPAGKDKLAEVIDRSRAVLGIPADYRVGIVPASDTGAMELALWSLLGPRGVDVFAWESFGETWANDIAAELKLPTSACSRRRTAICPICRRPRPGATSCSPGTARHRACASPMQVDRRDRTGLTHLRRDLGRLRHGVAVGQARCHDLVVAEGAGRRGAARHDRAQPARGAAPGKPHAILAAAQDLPPDPGWPAGEGIFKGETINTPSLLAVEDHLDALKWAERIGGLPALIARAEANLAAIEAWVARSPWVAFLADQEGRTLLHLGLPEDGRPEAVAPKKLAACSKPSRSPSTSTPIAMPRPACASGPAPRSRPTIFMALFPWLDWARGAIGMTRIAATIDLDGRACSTAS